MKWLIYLLRNRRFCFKCWSWTDVRRRHLLYCAITKAAREQGIPVVDLKVKPLKPEDIKGLPQVRPWGDGEE